MPSIHRFRLVAGASVAVLLAGLLAGSALAGPGDDASPPLDDPAYASLIHRLEVGMTALKELHEQDALERLQRIANHVRERRAAARKGRGDAAPAGFDPHAHMDALRHRLEILGQAQDVFRDAKKEDFAKYLARVINAGERQQAGTARPEDAQGISVNAVVELLRASAKLQDERGNERRAALARALADWYQHPANEGGEEAHAREREGHGDLTYLDDRAKRLEVLKVAEQALAEAGHGDEAEWMGRFVKLGELQLAGASAEALGQAAEGLSMERVIQLLRVAGSLLHEESGGAHRAYCLDLARFYERRSAGESDEATEAEEGEEHEGQEEQGEEHESREHERDADGHEAHADGAHPGPRAREAGARSDTEVRQQLRVLRAELEALRNELEQLERAVGRER